jgi:hypothetical protein
MVLNCSKGRSCDYAANFYISVKCGRHDQNFGCDDLKILRHELIFLTFYGVYLMMIEEVKREQRIVSAQCYKRI